MAARKKISLQISHVGPIERADVQFGDLTVLVGPQATGKSVFLQFFKLLIDTGAILAALKDYGLDWKKDVNAFLDMYLGEGMHGMWRGSSSELLLNSEPVDLNRLIARQKKVKTETTFFIPAQRVLTLARGWPRPFTDYSPGDPFTVRDFSEKLRSLMEAGLGDGESLFPQTRRLKKEIRDLLGRTVFSQFGLEIDKRGAQKRLVLHPSGSEDVLPVMVWSAGQREFVPLLLGLYWLLPPTKVSRRGEIEWVVIEELEMGLHPKAVSSVMILVFELLSRGYRVCLSTHSPHVLDVVWALRTCQQYGAPPQQLLRLFDVPSSQTLRNMAERVLSKEARVFYFDPDTQASMDISALDPGSEDSAEAGWGGLTEFSGRVADVVAEVVSGQAS